MNISSSTIEEMEIIAEDQGEITEAKQVILDCEIGYCRYGNGPINFLFICGGVGIFFSPVSNLF